MNRYGQMAQKVWSDTSPSRVSAIEDQTAFFTDLGNQVEARVDELIQSMQGPDVAGESVLGKMARLNAVKMQAEEIAIQELVSIAQPASVEESVDDGDRPSQERVSELLQELQENETEMSTEEYEERLAHLKALQTN